MWHEMEVFSGYNKHLPASEYRLIMDQFVIFMQLLIEASHFQLSTTFLLARENVLTLDGKFYEKHMHFPHLLNPVCY